MKLTKLEMAQISREYEIGCIEETLQDEYGVDKQTAAQLSERIYNGVCNTLGEILPDIEADVISIVLEENGIKASKKVCAGHNER